MNWEQLCDDPALESLPYRVQLARHGQVITSPHRSYHSIYQSRIIRWLNVLLPEGEALPECPVEASPGVVLVADVAWASAEKVGRNFDLAQWASRPKSLCEYCRRPIRRKKFAGNKMRHSAEAPLSFGFATEPEPFVFSTRPAPWPSPESARVSRPASPHRPEPLLLKGGVAPHFSSR